MTMRPRLLALLDALKGRRTVVIGDIAADEFLYGRVARVSREAPVLILEYDTTEIVPGGAGNAANNVAALDGRARLFGCVGRDAQGERLLAALSAPPGTISVVSYSRIRTGASRDTRATRP